MGQIENKKMVDFKTSISTIHLEGSSDTYSKTEISRLDNKARNTTCSPKCAHFKYEDVNKLKVIIQKKIKHADSNQKKAGLSILISE